MKDFFKMNKTKSRNMPITGSYRKGVLTTFVVLVLGFLLNIAFAFPVQQETQSGTPEATQQQNPNLQSAPEESQAAVAAKQEEVKSQAETFIGLVTLGGFVAYMIIGVFAIGIILIAWNAVELFLDYKNARELIGLDFKEISLNQLKNSLENRQKSYLKELLQHILRFYEAGDDATEIHEELTGYVNIKTERYETYRNWLSYLADAAGGLGLLGTVWGIFQTFFGGALDPDKILNGMGIALITTLVGVVVSMIINLGATKLFGTFNKRMEDISQKGDELRLHLLDLDAKKPKKKFAAAPVAVPAGEAAPATNGNAPDLDFSEFLQDLKTTLVEIGSRPVENTATATRRTAATATVVKDNPGFIFEVDNSLPKTIPTGASLQKALKITLLDQAGLPIQKAKIFLSADGRVNFDNNKKSLERQTDKKGEIAVNLYTGEKMGHGEVHYWLDSYPDDKEILEFTISAGEPEKIIMNGGDDQIGLVGQALSQPFQVIVKDQFDNFVENADILFDTLEGDGVLNGLQKQCVSRTDKNGYAEATYTLGKQAHFHRINAKIKGGKGQPIIFHVLGKARNV